MKPPEQEDQFKGEKTKQEPASSNSTYVSNPSIPVHELRTKFATGISCAKAYTFAFLIPFGVFMIGIALRPYFLRYNLNMLAALRLCCVGVGPVALWGFCVGLFTHQNAVESKPFKRVT